MIIDKKTIRPIITLRQGDNPPKVDYAIEMKLDEAVDEDDEGEPRNPRAYLLRQAKRIRNGETAERLTTLLPP